MLRTEFVKWPSTLSSSAAIILYTIVKTSYSDLHQPFDNEFYAAYLLLRMPSGNSRSRNLQNNQNYKQPSFQAINDVIMPIKTLTSIEGAKNSIKFRGS